MIHAHRARCLARVGPIFNESCHCFCALILPRGLSSFLTSALGFKEPSTKDWICCLFAFASWSCLR